MKPKDVARKLVEESIVLLKNEENLLPFDKSKEIAILGRAQIGTFYSGNGSGRANITGCATILEACEEKGISPEPLLKGFYTYKSGEEKVTEEDEFDWTKVNEAMNSGFMYEIFGKYHAPLEEYEVPEYLIRQASEKTDTAMIVIGRNSGGEECDRHLTDDYDLTKKEIRLLNLANQYFDNIVIALNINGLIDLSWTEKYEHIKGMIFLGIPGEEGASALAGILTGEINPSGKMAVTIAKNYKDYPSADHFSWNKDSLEEILTYKSYGLSEEENGSVGFHKSPVSLYWEDIFAGYRYFDTFGKQVLYPFGYGLSYTSFDLCKNTVEKKKDGIMVCTQVINTGERAGKEVVQLYLSKQEEKNHLERPHQELKGFEKTSVLEPGRGECLKFLIPWREFAVYDEKNAIWVIESGNYILRLGRSSRDNIPIGIVCTEEKIVMEQCLNRLELAKCNQGKIKFLTKKTYKADTKNVSKKNEEEKAEVQFNTIYIQPEDICKREIEVMEESMDNRQFFSDMSDSELACLCVGYGPGIPFSAVGDTTKPCTIYDETQKPLTSNSHPKGYPGYVSPAMERKGIKSIFYKDGPAGIGGIAWPTEMLIACSFNKKLWYMFGEAVGTECEEQQVDVWLGPAVNLHRNPLGGRNFEYFSEDPYLTGICACEITKGVQEKHSVLVCAKHFAVNEQETFRRGSNKRNVDAVDSILTERAARELYLKPFEMLVRNAEIACIMTSFNKINGTFAGGSKDLCTHILREEWGFDGAVVTDWGDMDVVVDGADAIAAGNDIIMPGGPPVIQQILEGLKDNRVTREEMEKAVSHLMTMLRRVQRFDR